MQRYFIEERFHEGTVTLTGDDARHITKVMRMREGEEIIVVECEETAHICAITAFNEHDVLVQQTGRTIPSPELPIDVTIACGLPKGDKLDLIVQKGTELGMYGILPFEAARSIVKWDAKKSAKKIERLQKIAKEAAEQSHRTHIPVVEQPVSFAQLVKKCAKYDVVFVADEEDAKLKERTRLVDKLKKIYDCKSILVIFGPEGGIARDEAEKLRAAGVITTSLGPRILRAETAPLYMLSAISYEFE